MRRLTALIAGLAFLIAAGAELHGQMPDWSEFRDLEGNIYYYDRAGKIWIIEKTRDALKPVTSDGIEYHLNRGLTCLREKKIPQGLTVLKSILAMKTVNNMVAAAQGRAASEINRLKKSEMNRFDIYNEKSCLLLVRDEGITSVMNDRMGYSFEVRGEIELIRTRERRAADYLYTGTLWGIRSGTKGKGADGYDLMVAVDCERFKGPLQDMDEALGHMTRVTGFREVVRKTLEKDDRKMIMSFTSGAGSGLSGYDGVFTRGNYLFMVRVAGTKALHEQNKSSMDAIIRSFRALPGGSLRDAVRLK